MQYELFIYGLIYMPTHLNKISTVVYNCGAISPEALFNALCIDYLAPNPNFFKHTPHDHEEAARQFIQLFKSKQTIDIRKFLNEYFAKHKLVSRGEFAALLQMFLICHPEYLQFLPVEIKDNLPAIKPEQGELKEILNLMLGFDTHWRKYFVSLLEKNKIFKLTRSGKNIDKDCLKILSIPSIFESFSKGLKLEIIEVMYKKAKSGTGRTQRQAFKALSQIFGLIPIENSELSADLKEEKQSSILNSKLKTIKIEIAELFFSKLAVEELIDVSLIHASIAAFKGSYRSLNADQKRKLIDKLKNTIAEKIDFTNFSFGHAIMHKQNCIKMLADLSNEAANDTVKEISEFLINLFLEPSDSESMETVYEIFNNSSYLTTGNEIKIIEILLAKVNAKDVEYSQKKSIKASIKLLATLFLSINDNVIQTEKAEQKEVNLREAIYQCIIANLDGSYHIAAMQALTIIYLAESRFVDKIEIIHALVNTVAHSKEKIQVSAIQSLMALQNSVPENCKAFMNDILSKAINFENPQGLVCSTAYLALQRFSSFPEKHDPEVVATKIIDAGIETLDIPVPEKGDNFKIYKYRKALIQNLVAIANLPSIPDTERSKVFKVCLENVKNPGQFYEISMNIKDMLFQMATTADEKKKLLDVLKSDLKAGLSTEANQLMLIIRKLAVHTQKDLKLLVVALLIEHLSSFPASNINSLKSTIIELTQTMDRTQHNYIIFGCLFPKINSFEDLGIRAHLIHVLGEISEDRLISSKINSVMENAFEQYKNILSDAGINAKMKVAYEQFAESIEEKGNNGCKDILQIVNAYRR
jgi:hypothetical protein